MIRKYGKTQIYVTLQLTKASLRKFRITHPTQPRKIVICMQYDSTILKVEKDCYSKLLLNQPPQRVIVDQIVFLRIYLARNAVNFQLFMQKKCFTDLNGTYTFYIIYQVVQNCVNNFFGKLNFT